MERRTIAITGKSTLNVKTDYVKIRFEINEIDLSYENTMSLLTKKAMRIKDVILKCGFKEEDLKTSDFSIDKSTRYNDKSKKLIFLGYRAQENLNIAFPIDNDKINLILNGIWKEVQEVDFNISFFCDNPNKYENQLIQMATKDAKEKATMIADALGVKLANVERVDFSFSEIHIENELEYDLNYNVCCDAAPSYKALPDMNPQDTKLEKHITIIWEIE